MGVSECYVCANNARVAGLPPRERIIVEDGWRAAHAFDTSLPGWLVLAPTRHVVSLHELTADESTAMGSLLVRLSSALRETVGCVKTYVMLFAEADGFAHLHYHLVPRMADFEPTQVGPGVFSFLGKAEDKRIPVAEQDDLALRIAAALAR